MLELAQLLGRAVVPSELVGGQHGQPPGAMAGAIASAKTSKGLGVSKTLDALLLENLERGALRLIQCVAFGEDAHRRKDAMDSRGRG